MYSNQFRLTPIRQAILRSLEASDRPLTISDLKKISTELANANKTTLYRDLELLIHHGIVRSITARSDVTYFELAHLNHHHHALCTQCLTVVDVPCQDNNHPKLNNLNGFHITSQEVIYQGICPQCQ